MTMLLLKVFYNEQVLANIISFSAVARKFRITIDIDLYPAINVHLNNDTIIIFKQCIGGCYYFDTINM